MRALVTGGAGFIGSHLVERLLQRGDEVVALDNEVTGRWGNLPDHPRLTRLHQDAVAPFDVDGPLDVVAHLASPASPIDFLRIPLEVLRVNSIGTENALRLAERKGARFLFASTSEVYGDPAVSPQPESYWGNVNPIGPRSPYDESKRYGEALVTAWHRVTGLEVRTVRYFNTYGPRMRADDGRAVPTFLVQALRGEPLTVQGDGQQTRSFAYVDDSVEGTLRLLASGVEGPVNVGSDHEVRLIDLARAVIRLTGSSSEVVHVQAAEDDPRRRRPDLTRARLELDYEPTVPLEDGLRRTIAWFRAEGLA